jgi:hypothetical protein
MLSSYFQTDQSDRVMREVLQFLSACHLTGQVLTGENMIGRGQAFALQARQQICKVSFCSTHHKVFNRLIRCTQLPGVPSSACLGHCLYSYQALDSSTIFPTTPPSGVRCSLCGESRLRSPTTEGLQEVSCRFSLPFSLRIPVNIYSPVNTRQIRSKLEFTLETTPIL